MECPDEARIADFVSRTLPDQRVAELEQHFVDCDDCRKLVFALANPEAESLHVDRLGRFELIEVIGRGAMGVVYRARDPELDRQVAVKVHRRLAPLDIDGEARLRREAQALAKLAHRNVVAVYEAGRHDDLAYVAMEFVDGAALDHWLATPRALATILEVLAGAGRGLAAAHEVGLVHRDIKPRNILVAGTVAKVGDFGLVRGSHDSDRGARDLLASAPDLAVTLSATGSLIGTPAYMAPEQLRGEVATFASDQFAFCVTMFEAIYGRRPFVASTFDELIAALKRPVEIPAEPRVPRAVRHVLTRGLSIDPSERFPSLGALLDELPGERRARWPYAVAAVSVLGLAGGVTSAVTVESPPDATCTGGQAELAAVWDLPRRELVRAAFRATQRPRAAEIAERTIGLLDRYAESWIAAQRESCEATHIRHVQAPSAFELRGSCLDERRSELRALTDLLARADADVVSHAIDGAAALRTVDHCGDLAALAQVVPPPVDPAQALEVASVRGQLAAMKAELRLARADRVVDRARQFADVTRKLNYPPLHADALIVLGSALHDRGANDEAIRVLRDAAATADAGRDDRLRFDAWTRLIDVLVFTGRVDQLTDAVQQAHAILARTPYDAKAHHQLLLLEGHVLVAQNEPKRAVVKYRELIAAQQSGAQPDHLALAHSWMGLADALARSGAIAEGGLAAKRAAEIMTNIYGEDPAAERDARADANRAQLFQGMLLIDQQKPAEGLAIIEPALASLTRLLGPDHETVGMGAHILGLAYHALDRNDDARTQHRRALAIHTAVDPKSIPVAAALGELAAIDYDDKRYDRAAEQFVAAGEIYARERGAASKQAAAANLWTARALIGAHRLDEAAQFVKRTRALGGEIGGAPAVVALDGEILIERGRVTEGLAILTKAFELPPGRGEWVGRAELAMARGLLRDRRVSEARVHVERAVAAFDRKGRTRDAEAARAQLATLDPSPPSGQPTNPTNPPPAHAAPSRAIR